MTAPLTGFDPSTFPADVLLDSGIVYVGATAFGAFAGGIKFDPGVTYRNIEFDGKRTNMKGLDRVTQRMPKISGTVITLGTSSIAKIEPGSDVNATGGWTGATSSNAPQAAGTLLVSGDYLTDVRAIWMRGGTTTAAGSYVQVRFPSAICTKYDISGTDGSEVAIAIEIEARLDTAWAGYAGPGTAPFRIEYLTALNPA